MSDPASRFMEFAKAEAARANGQPMLTRCRVCGDLHAHRCDLPTPQERIAAELQGAVRRARARRQP